MKALTILLATLMPAILWAAEDESVVVFNSKLFTYQCINVVIMIAGLVYFLRAGTVQFFKDKRKNYLAAAEKSQQAKRMAEQERAEIQAKLNRLEDSADESLARARAEAVDMRKALVTEAEGLSRRLHNEAEKSANMETERAKNHLREQVIKEAMVAARNQLSSKVSQEDHQRLQGEFVHHMQANSVRGAQK